MLAFSQLTPALVALLIGIIGACHEPVKAIVRDWLTYHQKALKKKRSQKPSVSARGCTGQKVG